MSRDLQTIIAALDRLNQETYEIEYRKHTFWFLQPLCDDILALPQPKEAIKAMFGVFERVDAADLGVPGPFVHTLEQLGGYEAELIASIRRKPTYYPIWMVNRILNGLRHDGAPQAETLIWHQLLQEVVAHPAATESNKQEALEFIEHQRQMAAQRDETR